MTELREQFGAFLTELMRANRLDSLIIAIDALDELPDPAPSAAAITSLLPSPDQLPNGCFILLTSRPTLRPGIRWDAAAADITRILSYLAPDTERVSSPAGLRQEVDTLRDYLGRLGGQDLDRLFAALGDHAHVLSAWLEQ